jgi:hypothetical protein
MNARRLKRAALPRLAPISIRFTNSALSLGYTTIAMQGMLSLLPSNEQLAANTTRASN